MMYEQKSGVARVIVFLEFVRVHIFGGSDVRGGEAEGGLYLIWSILLEHFHSSTTRRRAAAPSATATTAESDRHHRCARAHARIHDPSASAIDPHDRV